MIQKNNKKLSLIVKGGKKVSAILYKNIKLWSTTNSKTFDNFTSIDNKTFNIVK